MSAQQEIELILARQLASYLGVPVFIVDSEGALLFYNESAERILGRRFEEYGKVPLEEWARGFQPREEDGTPIPPEEVPLVVSLTHARPAHRGLYIRGLDDVRRYIEVTSFPLVGPESRVLGALAVFWEAE